MDPRSSNGPEEARDYLWLTQDLWMEDTVWSWANNNPDAKNTVLKTCSWRACHVREVRVAEFKRCAACHLVGSIFPPPLVFKLAFIFRFLIVSRLVKRKIGLNINQVRYYYYYYHYYHGVRLNVSFFF